MSSTYLYSVNKVLNIDNSVNTPNIPKSGQILNQPSKCIVIGTDNLEVENNYNDKEGIDSQVRILGGTWTDELIVQNIFCHPSGSGGDIRPAEDTYTYKPQTNSDELTDTNDNANIIKNEINIGRMGNTINVDGQNIKIGTAGNQDTDNASANTGNHNTADHVKFAYNNSAVDIFGEDIKIGEKDTTTTMYGKHTVIGLSDTNFAQGININTALTDVSTSIERNHIQSGNGAYPGSTFDVYAEYVKIGEKDTKMNLYSKNLKIGISKNDEEGHEDEIAVTDTTVDMFGENIKIGQEDTTFKLYGKDIKIGVTNDDNRDFITTYDNEIDNVVDTKVEMKLYAGELKTGGKDSTTKMYTKNTFIGLNDHHNIDHHGANTTIGTNEGFAYANSTLDVYGETINIGQKNTDMTLFAENIIVGATHKDDNTDVHSENADRNLSTFDLYSKDIKIGYQDTTTILHSEEIRFNDNTDGTRFLIKDGVDADEYRTGNNSINDESLANYGALIEIGNGVDSLPHNTTAHIKLDASKITINAADELNLATAAFGLGTTTDPAYFLLDNNNSKIQIGSDILKDVRMHGSNIHIGESNGTVKIFGNVEMYSEGSNIVTNTNIETTSAFEINNTGTKTALTVVQTNQVSTEGYNLCEFFCADNQNRTPFRIDAFGRVGMGVKKYNTDGSTKKELKAWLHVYKNSPEDLVKDSGALAGDLTADDIDIFLVEDKRFQPIIKSFLLELLNTTTTDGYKFNITDRTNAVISNQADITIYVGDSIKIINNTGGHPFELTDPNGGDPLFTINNTSSETHTFNIVGTYTYVCTAHDSMTGNIIVQALPDYLDTNRSGDNEYDGTPFVIKNQGDVGIGTYKPRYKLDVWSTNSELNGQPNANGNIGSKGIALRDVVFIKQNNTNRVFYGFTRKIEHGSDQNAADAAAAYAGNYYETGMEFEFKNYNGEQDGDYAYASNPLDNDLVNGLTVSNNTETQNGVITGKSNYPFDGSNNTFGFRMSIKLHISGDNGQIAYRRFEAFISPQNNTSSDPQTPGLITIADLFDSEYEYYRFLDIKIQRLQDKKFKLIVQWKTQITTSMTSNSVDVPLSSRVYVDIEYFGHEYLGDIQAEIINNTITTTHNNAINW